jgi:tetratricopeptide (TPR) repeat protein
MNINIKALPLTSMLLAVATTALCQTKAEQAVAYFNQGIAATEWHGDAGYKKMLGKAIADFTKAIQLKPDYAEAYYERGSTKFLADVGDVRGAFADFTRAIQLKPDYAFAYSNRASARMHWKDFDGAIADYTKAIELRSDVKWLANFFDARGRIGRRSSGQSRSRAFVCAG